MAKKLTDRTAFAGETLTERFEVSAAATAVTVKLSDGVKSATVAATANGDGTWTAVASAETLAGFSGQTRWIAFETTPDGTEAVANGEIYIRALVSKYRAVVAAVEKALQNYGNSPNKSIHVGDLSITYKDYADLLTILNYWRSRAEADENGTQPTGGVKFLKVRFG